jgi:adenylate cyclase
MLTPGAFSPQGVPLIRAAHPPSAAPTTFATVLCANLHGYDVLAQVLQPCQLVPLIEDYFALLTDAVLEFGGQVFHLADADLTAGFGLGDSRHTQIREALASARAIHRRFAALRRSWHQRWAVQTAIGVGIHRGEFAIAVFEQTAEPSLVIVGDTANVAAALSHRARAGEILLSTAVYGAPPPAAPATLDPDVVGLGHVQLHGRRTALDLWCVPAAERLRLGVVEAAVPSKP